MSATVFLCPDVHAVRIGDDLVFLDVAADRYLCWPDAGVLPMSADRRRLTAPDSGVREDLMHAGLITEKSLEARVRCRSVVEPLGDLCDAAPAPMPWPRRVDFVRGS